jgi:hypothetical protein
MLLWVLWQARVALGMAAISSKCLTTSPSLCTAISPDPRPDPEVDRVLGKTLTDQLIIASKLELGAEKAGGV